MGHKLLNYFTACLLICCVAWIRPHQKQEVDEAMNQYNRYILSMNTDSIASIFAPDGDLGNIAHGRDSIRLFLNRFKDYQVLSQTSTTDSMSSCFSLNCLLNQFSNVGYCQVVQQEHKIINVYLKGIKYYTSYSNTNEIYSGIVFLGKDTLKANVIFSDNFGSCMVKLYDSVNNLKGIRKYTGNRYLYKMSTEAVFNDGKGQLDYKRRKVFTPN